MCMFNPLYPPRNLLACRGSGVGRPRSSIDSAQIPAFHGDGVSFRVVSGQSF